MALQRCSSLISNILRQEYLSKCLLRSEVPSHYVCIRNNSKSREARFMMKIMGKREIKKRYQVFNQEPLGIDKHSQVKRKIDSRRMTVLNKLFMQKITDILATGNLHYDLVHLGVLVTKVEISSDFNNLSVFWYSSSFTENIDNILDKIAAKLYHELTQLHLMGFVPTVRFLKDKDKIRSMEVQKLLSTVSSELENTECDTEEIEESNLEDEKLPDMITDVYGLKHDAIMKKIGFSMSKKSDFVNSLKEQDSSESGAGENK